MELHIHKEGKNPVAELKSSEVLITELQDAVDLLGNADYLGARSIVVGKENLDESFFKLSTGFAGEVLQKFSNYRMRLAIAGDFSSYNSKSLADFIRESNRVGRILFVNSRSEGITKLASE